MNSRNMTLEEDRNTMLGEQVLLRIFIGERDKYKHIPLYEALVELFRKEGLAGATVLRGIAGFGAHSMYHTDRLLRLSTDLPIVLEVVDQRERIEAVLPTVEEMMDGGLITMEKVLVVRYARKRSS
jgi:PII-like signaling protein